MFGSLLLLLPLVAGQLIKPSTVTVPAAFPTSLYKSYYNDPTATTAQVQPIISDPITVRSLAQL
jgi:sphingomyelin phosphodiesterase